MNASELVNWVEVFFWPALGLGCLAHAARRHPGTDPLTWLLGAAFIIFGISDYLELRTGAWWRPPALLVLKAGCIAVFLAAAIRWRRRTGKRNRTGR